MIERPKLQPVKPPDLARDERSMRVFEYAMAFVAVAAAALLAIR